MEHLTKHQILIVKIIYKNIFTSDMCIYLCVMLVYKSANGLIV